MNTMTNEEKDGEIQRLKNEAKGAQEYAEKIKEAHKAYIHRIRDKLGMTTPGDGFADFLTDLKSERDALRQQLAQSNAISLEMLKAMEATKEQARPFMEAILKRAEGVSDDDPLTDLLEGMEKECNRLKAENAALAEHDAAKDAEAQEKYTALERLRWQNVSADFNRALERGAAKDAEIEELKQECTCNCGGILECDCCGDYIHTKLNAAESIELFALRQQNAALAAQVKGLKNTLLSARELMGCKICGKPLYKCRCVIIGTVRVDNDTGEVTEISNSRRAVMEAVETALALTPATALRLHDAELERASFIRGAIEGRRRAHVKVSASELWEDTRRSLEGGEGK